MPSSNTPLLNLSLLIDVTFSTPTGLYAQISIPFDSVHTGSIRLKSEDE